MRDTIFEKRIDWLKKYIRDNDNCFDMLNVQFVDSFIDRFNVSHDSPFIGARHCPILGRFLTEAHSKGYLSRIVISLREGPGYPNWIYGYYMYKSYLQF
ncbi:hypothetical protein KAR91_52205 [Candidatus Pacearchaeota archaeon]|nr:hypothetical protein [Candidatus Pacearchaeota archaeon]